MNTNNYTVEIRPMTEQDIKEVVEIYIRYLQHFGYNADRKVLESFLSRLIQEDWVLVMLAVINEHVRGFITSCNSYSPISACFALQLTDIYVDTEFRRNGIGNRLVRTVEEYAISIGMQKLFGEAEHEALPFFLRQGWERSHQHCILKKL